MNAEQLAALKRYIDEAILDKVHDYDVSKSPFAQLAQRDSRYWQDCKDAWKKVCEAFGVNPKDVVA